MHRAVLAVARPRAFAVAPRTAVWTASSSSICDAAACRSFAVPSTRLFHASAVVASAPAAAPAAASSNNTAAPATNADGAALVAPAFGTNGDAGRRFVYIKGVKNDGRSKRFYAQVDIAPVKTTRGIEYGITLDGRFIVTPYNQILTAPNQLAAEAIAFEWDSQGDFIRPISMPLSNICVTALDQALHDRARFLTHFKGAMAMDSVLLRVHQPSGLVHLQRKHYEPLVQWMRERYGCDLQTTFEIETPVQSEAAMAKQHALLDSLTGWQLAALDSLTTVTKSFLISWALLTEKCTIEQAFEAARLEENFQMRQYGQVDGVYGHGIDMEFTRMTLAAAKTWVNLVTEDAHTNPLLHAHAK